MAAGADIGREVLELLESIDPHKPRVDRAHAEERLRAYVEALGLEAPTVRWHPDIRTMRITRVWPGDDRSRWESFSGRHWRVVNSALLGDPFWDLGPAIADWRRQLLGRLEPRLDPERSESGGGAFERSDHLAATDTAVLSVGLGSAREVVSVCHVAPALHTRARELLAGAPVPLRCAALLPLAEAAASGLFAFALGRGRTLVAVERPVMRFDEAGRLHEWDGSPAVSWPRGKGKGLYFWRGVHMTEQVGREPDRLTPRRITGWTNAERRRVAIERIGLETFLRGIGATIVQQDDFGRLWRSPRPIDGEPFVAVEVVNATEEPDGTRRRYFLRVPPPTRTARAGVAWTFGYARTGDYVVAAES